MIVSSAEKPDLKFQAGQEVKREGEEADSY
jgi:hypothetical protein